uniref:CENP-V/GFA domain-containing protein n=1 Tax=Chromera velia CCMP2878 TaxID=1169474 RepID=A0A0G4HZR4_9ALVE|mmetsp:Transcript_3742/g.7708  ORF Transcript_3742/g.7708 Transcript_3742/m.7708 type:complete len:152 (+) Transcript_3742:206-661(+)|eukprot:Cvel_34073.t1-p1 / transcript=Cvel_34073.t1 / gene=Cvel_34073 / organism=Chromera_velia_CCMP2878 / gene_product=hypothetical protein / transcript_product=hypothetical protein / location=Cvel_scaffold5729:1837-3923(-) / protein_length=151 / sequence_SO=supercontig / SO=protein_coding / is_pseudo=false
MKGSCFCGAWKFRVKEGAKPSFSVYCHCRLCTKFYGAVTALVGWSKGDLDVSEGEENLKGFKSSEAMTRFHCTQCGGPAYNQSHMEGNEFRDLPLLLFDSKEEGSHEIDNYDVLRPKAHIHFAPTEMDSVWFEDGLPKFSGFPGSPIVQKT